ncbi:MAG: alpha/beta fold hydrolase [Nannocystaceae bacterium]
MIRSVPRLALLLLSFQCACGRGSPETTPPEPRAMATTVPEPAVDSEAGAVVPEGPLRYRVEVSLPAGGPLTMWVELRSDAEQWSGTITIPQQLLYDGALSEVVVAKGEVSYGLDLAGARWSAVLAPDGTTEQCTFAQGGVELPCSMELTDEATFAAVRLPPRPQTPEPPFPYDAIDVEYDNTTDGIHLAGTLTVPRGPGPYPAALLITGSGAQDRDESLLGHKPFLVLADHLTRQGIAVLRVDDRGVGGSTGSLQESTGEALARDVAAGVAWLRADPRIDPARVGLVGHSEGAVLGPRVAAEDPKIAFVVMMAGTGVPGAEVVREQSAAILRAKDTPAASVEIMRNRQARAMQVVAGDADTQTARAELAEILGGSGPQVDAMLTTWFRDFARYDPAPTLRKLRCPVLVLNGELDLQVLPDQNLPAIEQALRKNRKRVTVRRLPGLNHLFQPAKTGLPEEYVTIAQTIDPQVLTIVGDWIVAQTKVGPKAAARRR